MKQPEWVILANLVCLLMGFALLSHRRKESRAGSVVEVPSPRLEGRFCAVGDGMDSLQFS